MLFNFVCSFKMSTDHRREWIKDRVTKFLGLNSGDYFEDMMVANDGELEEQLTSFLDDDLLQHSVIQNKLFYFYRTSYDRLFEEEILVPQIGMLEMFRLLQNLFKVF